LIPRFKPYLGWEEFKEIFRRHSDSVRRFEQEFARTFDARYALAFPYGRSALWAFFKCVGIEGAEIILPAYTCSVVAHAIVLSGNIPRFVDVTLYDFNMDLDKVEAAIHEKTHALIATHLFGYPLDVERLQKIIQKAERQIGHKIWVIQDCAHSFGAHWQGKLVCRERDMALFGLNISKTITSIFGGMITTQDSELYGKIRTFRDEVFIRPNLMKRIRRIFYLLLVYPSFYERIYGLVNWLEEETPMLDKLTKAYHLDEKIYFPPDYLDRMIDLEAGIGLVQLRKYPEILRRRKEKVRYYHERLEDLPGLVLPPLVDGATYSHYVVRVPNRKACLSFLRQQGVQLGQLIDYSIPHTRPYGTYVKEAAAFDNSLQLSQSIVNLPIYPALNKKDIDQVAFKLRNYFKSSR
jgi:perosamine synthetase